MIDPFQENSRRKRSLGDLKRVFRADTEVDWSEFQAAKVRVKRDPIRLTDGSDKEGRDSRLEDKVNSLLLWFYNCATAKHSETSFTSPGPSPLIRSGTSCGISTGGVTTT